MFQFPALAFYIVEWYLFKVSGCPIRKSPDQRSFAPTRSLSQLITSFFASESLGIRHVLFFTYSTYRASSDLKTGRFDLYYFALTQIIQVLMWICIQSSPAFFEITFIFKGIFTSLLKKNNLFSIINMSKIDRNFFFLESYGKWRITDSNRWPPACKAGALASWANSPFWFY